MAAKKVEVISIKIGSQAGSFLPVYAAFEQAKVDVLASWAYQMGPTDASAQFFTKNNKKALAALTKAGIASKLQEAVYVSGKNKVGAYRKLLEKIAAAGISLDASDALAFKDQYAALFFPQNASADELLKALKKK